jgi:predicted nucleic acid-binding protein
VAKPERGIERALLDASALIGYLKGEPDFACMKSLMSAVDRGDVTLVESTAILAEVMPGHVRDTEAHAAARQALRTLLEAPSTVLVDVSPPIARKAGELRVKHRMSTWDAVHLATAILASVDVLIVRDGKFSLGQYEGVRVSGPFDLDEGKLPISL